MEEFIMAYDPEKHHRRSIRLRGYDYSQAAPYFITIATNRGLSLFGHIHDGGMHLNEAGQMIEERWARIESKFPDTILDEHVTMPNHFHGIVCLMGNWMNMMVEFGVGMDRLNLDDEAKIEANEGMVELIRPSQLNRGRISTAEEVTLPRVVQWFKTMTTNDYIRGVRDNAWPRFQKRLWHRNYFEHIVRTDESLEIIRQYIRQNPSRWDTDRNNPDRSGDDEFDKWLDREGYVERN
jgi:REP element-mobilizing transposase RayT